jgi:hypothetical protein
VLELLKAQSLVLLEGVSRTRLLKTAQQPAACSIAEAVSNRRNLQDGGIKKFDWPLSETSNSYEQQA